MEHATAFGRLSAYLDGQLSPEVHAQVEAHLIGCPDCLNELQELQRTATAVRGLPLAMPSLALLQRLHASIETAAKKPILAMERFIGVLSGVAACLALIGGLMLMQPRTMAATPGSWERDAVQLSEDSTDAAPETAVGQWMVASLSGHEAAGGEHK